MHSYRCDSVAQHHLGLALVPTACLSIPGLRCTKTVALLIDQTPTPSTPSNPHPSSWEQQKHPWSRRCLLGTKPERGLAPSPVARPVHCPLALWAGGERALQAAKQRGGQTTRATSNTRRHKDMLQVKEPSLFRDCQDAQPWFQTALSRQGLCTPGQHW